MKQALIFDLDGTLVDSLQGIAASLNHALAESSLPGHPLGAVRELIGNGSRVLIQRAAPTTADECLLDTIEQAFKSHYDLNWQEGTTAYDGIAGMLGSLQAAGYPLAVLSNKPQPFTEIIVASIFPTIRFSPVLGQRTGIPHKPDPAGALEIAKQLCRRPAECSIIGDSTMDLETARSAGMRAIAVSWGFHDRERLVTAGAEIIVSDPTSLLACFIEAGLARPPVR